MQSNSADPYIQSPAIWRCFAKRNYLISLLQGLKSGKVGFVLALSFPGWSPASLYFHKPGLYDV
jgi:hypothetical protein